MTQFNPYDATRNTETEEQRVARERQNNSYSSRIAGLLDRINFRQSAVVVGVGMLSLPVWVPLAYAFRANAIKRVEHAPAIVAADTNRDGVTSVDEIVGMYTDIGLRVVEERPGVYTFNGKPIIDNGILQIDQPKLDSYVGRHQGK
ncbi:TPA: hypothetical protein HA251_07015 [Candidatus Woesearchaeota archaeon]|nr:hypothetical protein [Candidatus Woesearchaeota archaeon]